ncbi:MAG: thiamine phosphate synthase [Campylobacterota bacterium]|nr:thiamine phosphate synthase [Campylobacterota bacterium]
MLLHKSSVIFNLNKIYALCDFELLQGYNVTLEQYLNLLEKYNVIYIQYRDKINPLDIQKQNLQFLKANTDIPVIINDKLELLEFADGLHFGQEDLLRIKNEELKVKSDELLLRFLRKRYPNKIFGLSTHNEVEILEANKLDLDYIGLGAFRNTSTKDVPNILGDKISYLAKISKYPVGAIGGVRVNDNIENISFNVIGSDLLKQ